MPPLKVGVTEGLDLSPRLRRALDVMIDLHVEGAACIRSSLLVRDYLLGLGFYAKVMPVGLVIRAYEHGRELHSVGVGMAAALYGVGLPTAHRKHKATGWDGHLIVLVRDNEPDLLLIDPSLGQARRPAWPDLPAMQVVETVKPSERHKLGGAMAALTHQDPSRGYRLQVQWFANIRNTAWRQAPEANVSLRADILRQMLAAARESEDDDAAA